MWKQRNPDYMKHYRASQREAKPDHPAARPAVRELERLLSLVKNNLVKNASAFRVKRCASGVWLIAPKKTAADKNIFAPTHVIVIQGITVDEQAKKRRKNSALVIPAGVTYKWT